jgi:hypothetical protein
MDGPSFVTMGFFREREPARTIPRGIFAGIIQLCDLPAFFSKIYRYGSSRLDGKTGERKLVWGK